MSTRNVVAAALVAAVLHSAAWTVAHESVTPPDVRGVVESVSYNLDLPWLPPDRIDIDRLERIRRDLALLAGVTHSVRMYSSTGVLAAVPPIARELGLEVTAGAWIKGDAEANRREIEAAIALIKRNKNVRALVVGNETILREEQTVEQLTGLLRAVRKRVRVPVSTGETWDTWLAHPELAKSVDFIAAHILPYWEGIPSANAVAHAIDRYEALKKAFPKKKVVIAEFGWPSRGYNNRESEPAPLAQAEIVRRFVVEAEKRKIPYNLAEAFDQPWKTAEGSVGPYWGIFAADRGAKFSLAGAVEEKGSVERAVLALLLGAVVSVFVPLRRRPTFLHALAFAVAANALAGVVAVALAYPFENYLNPGSAFAWMLGVLLMLPLTAMTLIKVHEVAEVTLGRPPVRLLGRCGRGEDPGRLPKVSIHIPACRERPDMLIETLNGVARLDYPDFEVLVVVNNTPEEHYWRPVLEHCRLLGPRFTFLNFPEVSGFKAGALNRAMAHVAPDAEILAILDADYVVDRDWLKELVPAFADPKVALVQAPQDHRDHRQSRFQRVMNAEYAGFFDIGMVQRNEDDAIIAHGTMLLLRRAAFERVGGWSTDTLTEDTELGLRLFAAGWSALYTNRRYGFGLLPESYLAYKTQRHRWVYGAVQIVRKHWRHMLPRTRALSAAQKFRFVTGWSHWLADAVGAVVALLNLAWVPMVLFVGVLLPPVPFTLPILAAFAVNLLHSSLLYGTRVRIPPADIGGAALAAASLQWTVARAILDGLIRTGLPFRRTEKGTAASSKRKRRLRSVGAEAILGPALVLGAAALFATNEARVTETTLFASTLAVQAVPFLAAVAMSALERLAQDRERGVERQGRAPGPLALPAVTDAAGGRAA